MQAYMQQNLKEHKLFILVKTKVIIKSLMKDHHYLRISQAKSRSSQYSRLYAIVYLV